MAVTTHVVQAWLWKILKSSSKSLLVISRNHPFPSISFVCLFLLYIFSPSSFGILIYSLPIALFFFIVLRLSLFLHRRNCKDEDGIFGRKTKFTKHDDISDKDTKSFKRVHSVRRRRSNKIMWDDNTNNTPQNVEDKSAIFSTSFNNDNLVDKKALTEESPKEIREVEMMDSSIMHGSSFSHILREGFQGQILDGSEDEEEEDGREDGNKAAVEWTENDQKNVMEVGISEIERNKRLESLISRRRARKLLGLQVRRTLMNMDRNMAPSQVASLIIPKHANTLNLNYGGGHVSPTPGSAPSVMVPMRNPFDIPYDPQEEKPDLTGDSFDQEFTLAMAKDMMFCRHESFGPRLFGQGENGRDGEQASSIRDSVGFWQRDSSHGYQFPKLQNHFDEEGFQSAVAEPAPPQVPEPESIIDNENDHIKEVIQVSENEVNNLEEGETIDEINTQQIPNDRRLNTSSASEETSEDEPFRIDREAILKSLSSPSRRHEMRINYHETEENHPNYSNFLGQAMQHHTPSYSIASDLQVEISDVGSPPLTIDENISLNDDITSLHDGSLGKVVGFGSNIDLCGDFSDFLMKDGSKPRSREASEVGEQDIMDIGFLGTNVNTKERTSKEEHSMHSRFSLPPLDVFQGTGSARSTFLDAKIEEVILTPIASRKRRAKSHEVLIFPVDENEEQSMRTCVGHPSQDDDSKKPEDSKEHSIKQFGIVEPEHVEHAAETQNMDGHKHQTDHLIEENLISSEDPYETLRFEQRHEEVPIVVRDNENLEPFHQSELGERSSSNGFGLTSDSSQVVNMMQDVVAEQIPVFQTSSTSPKSVLHSTFSMASFDQYIEGDGQQSGARTSEASSPVGIEQSTTPSTSNGNAEILQESSEPPTTSMEEEAKAIEQLEIHEKNANDGSSMSISHESAAEPIKPTEKIRSNALINVDENSNQISEPSSNTNSSLPITKKSSEPPTTSMEEETKAIEQLEIHEKNANDGSSMSNGHESAAEPIKPTEEIRSNALINVDENSNQISEPSNNTNSSLPTTKEFSEHPTDAKVDLTHFEVMNPTLHEGNRQADHSDPIRYAPPNSPDSNNKDQSL